MCNFLWAETPDIPAENKWRIIKQYRNELLMQSDWTQMTDAVMTFSQRQAWQDYRQALRDIPQTFTNPDDVTFPEAPTYETI